jgi:hypothetical protein
MKILQPIDAIQRLEWLVSTELPIKLVPVELFNIEEVCKLYNGNPSLNDLKTKLHSFDGLLKNLLQAFNRLTS